MINRGMVPFTAAIVFASNVHANFEDVEVKIEPISDQLYVLYGAGGNIGISVGEDGLILIDTQYAELSPKIVAALDNQFPDVVNIFTLNTHYHGDHTGGNAVFSQHSYLVSHENVRQRLRANEAVSSTAWPQITYEHEMHLYLNNQDVRLIHPGPAHTDGDTAVIWTSENVVHTGDLFFRDVFPYIDLDGGGSVQGYLDAVNMLIDTMGADTTVIPGHGELAGREDYVRFRDMLVDTIAKVRGQKRDGLTLEEVLIDGVDTQYKSWSWRFITEEKWLTTLYRGLD